MTAAAAAVSVFSSKDSRKSHQSQNKHYDKATTHDKDAKATQE
jgi:hypothetical protein